MSSLSKTVKTTRQFVIAFIIFAVVVLVVQLVSEELSNSTVPGGGGTVRYYSFPTESSATYSRFNLNSVTLLNQTPSEFVVVGDFPIFPPVVNVYNVNEKRVRLSPLEDAEEIAEKFELNPNYIKLDDNNYIWEGSKNNIQFQFNTLNRNISITSDLLRASNEKAAFFSESEYIQNAINVTNSLGLAPQEEIEVTGRVDYIAINPNGDKVSLSQENSFLVRVTLFKTLESATILSQYKNSQDENVPKSIKSEIYRPNLIDGFITMIFNAEAKDVADVVELQYNPSEYIENTNTQSSDDIPYITKVYQAIELGQAFENIKNKETGTFLVYLRKEGEDIFSEFNPLNVAKFNIDATMTKTVYIEPSEWNHLNPDAEWDAHIYPFYWFEGQATLDNGEVAKFVFLVDVVPSN